jgi:23S rRNA pseudouridine2605 synthase
MTRKRTAPPPAGERSAAQRPGGGDGAATSSAWPDHPTADRLRRSDPPHSPAKTGADALTLGEGEADRIAKVMARAGLCSRRDAEEWIAAGRVAVNGGTISSPAVNVTPRDRITVDGKPLPRRERTRLFLYYKPVGLVSTNSDSQGRRTVFDVLPKNLPRLMSVGRLDIGTEGLLLLTNDGGLARVLELPDTAWVRRYRVRAHGRVSQAELDKLRVGISIEGIHYGPIEATLEREQGANIWLSFAIREGKNREVRNVLSHLGLQVNRLIRVEFGPFGLGALPEGGIEEVETKNLRAQLGDRVLAQAGCDFAGPVAERAAAPANREQRREERQEMRRVLRDRDRSRSHPGDDRGGARSPGNRDVGERDDRRPLRKSREERDERPEKPPGRPRRGHAWREDDAPLRRTYRGSRRDELKIADEDRPDKRAGLLTDRQGRRILVERFGTRKEKPEPAAARPQKPRRGPPRDRAVGPRPSRPRFSDDRAAEPRSAEPREFGPRKFGPRKFGSRSDRPRTEGPRQFEPRKFGPRNDRPRTDGPRKDGPGKSGSRSPRPSGSRSGPRPSGPRPPRAR